MKKIDLEGYKRKAIFERLIDLDIPHFAVNWQLDITHFHAYLQTHNLSFFKAFTYLISRCANEIPEFKHRIVDGELYACDVVHPSFTLLLPDETFCFCHGEYSSDFRQMEAHMAERMAATRENPTYHDAGQDRIFITSMPWFSFTAVKNSGNKDATIPTFTIGKYFQQGAQWLLPFGVQVHHGVMDALHVGKFYTLMCQYLENAEELLK